ncbi:MAG TPA: aminotransferase class I/II-fold pyridoxal phosphate-dependent enzyme, partial [Candidatus Sulfotelmatobacter sp.]|nr:aminotransferase class I/II-fold pyridoxal phosphate-dependent enzyme [Candidatus Sulfotelmatobacter sp.]
MSFDPTRLVRPEVRALTAYQAGPPPPAGAVKLDANESPFALGEILRGALAEELAKALADVALHRYPDPDARLLRQLLAEELGLTPDHVLLANGSDEAIQMLTMAVAGPESTVLAPVPTFAVYELSARMQGLRFVGVPLRPGFVLDEPAMHEALRRERPRLVFLAWPNNPTGRLFDEAAVERILHACAGESCQALVVVDEAYVAYSGRTFIPRLASHPNLVVFRTLSKIGLAGIRLGMIVAAPALVAEVNKVRMPYNVNALSQAAAHVVVRHGEIIRQHAALVVAERERLSAALQA